MGERYRGRFKNCENKYLDKNASKVELNGRKSLRGQKPPNSEVLAPDEKKKKKEKQKEKTYIQFAQHIMSSLLTVLVTATG
jgi:hypothetical protein